MKPLRHRIVIFEDQAVVRDLLVEVFASTSEYEVVGAFENGATGVEAAIALAPDVAIVDYALPGLNGFDVARRLVAAVPSARIVLLTALDRPEVLLGAVEAGIHGVVTKGTPLETLKLAVARVLASETYRCPRTSALLATMKSDERADPLTPREREIVRLVCSGFSSKEVAHRLSLSEKTVSNHRTNIMRKLNVHDVVSLTRYAVDRGLVAPHEPPT